MPAKVFLQMPSTNIALFSSTLEFGYGLLYFTLKLLLQTALFFLQVTPLMCGTSPSKAHKYIHN